MIKFFLLIALPSVFIISSDVYLNDLMAVVKRINNDEPIIDTTNYCKQMITDQTDHLKNEAPHNPENEFQNLKNDNQNSRNGGSNSIKARFLCGLSNFLSEKPYVNLIFQLFANHLNVYQRIKLANNLTYDAFFKPTCWFGCQRNLYWQLFGEDDALTWMDVSRLTLRYLSVVVEMVLLIYCYVSLFFTALPDESEEELRLKRGFMDFLKKLPLEDLKNVGLKTGGAVAEELLGKIGKRGFMDFLKKLPLEDLKNVGLKTGGAVADEILGKIGKRLGGFLDQIDWDNLPPIEDYL
ncbi:hypothetical protein HELRODRAFT_173444 [Helobdella robusta]|uniref:Uncharacterized protein n=1 Tax=Helobdella robusta TaxID=6412 RepID=T1F6U1_HELRO|nr:hypothetical protein HELRODRAFT_173444 [Helobdella robusta]ESO03743.1 hypothetical protein HELRODRAFT_173444 [Helobdella robusta]